MGTQRERAGRDRLPVIVVAGVHEQQVRATASEVRSLEPSSTALVHHDLRELDQGVVRRSVRRGDQEQVTNLELVHGCASCTLREDLLPLLRRLSEEPGVGRAVVRLDPALEPESVCAAIRHVPVDDRTVDEDVEIRAVLTAVDVPSWLDDAAGDEPLVERGLGAVADDERTLAQVAVGQAEFADGFVLAGAGRDRWLDARTEAVLGRLAPNAPIARLEGLCAGELLDRVPPNARRGAVDGPHGPLLRGDPPFEPDCGVTVTLFEHRRPFHPQRLHEAVDVLLDGTVRTRGRAWVATQPDTVLWLESAGGGLAVGEAGPWLASVPADDWAVAEPERQLRASMTWDEHYGDRMQELVVIAHEADPDEIRRSLRSALLTDDELGGGRALWRQWSDPFGEWHVDPCSEPDLADEADVAGGTDLADGMEKHERNQR